MKIQAITTHVLTGAFVLCALSASGQSVKPAPPTGFQRDKQAPVKQSTTKRKPTSKAGQDYTRPSVMLMAMQCKPGVVPDKDILVCDLQNLNKLSTVEEKSDYLATAIALIRLDFYGNEKLQEATEKATDELARENNKVINQNAAAGDYEANKVETLTEEVRDLTQKLSDFQAAACPVLRGARMDWSTKMNLDSACGLH